MNETLQPAENARVERAVIGPDVIAELPGNLQDENGEHVLQPGEVISLVASLPEDYQQDKYKDVYWHFSIRSRLAQAGLMCLPTRKADGSREFLVRNLNKASAMIIPKSLEIGRFFVTKEFVEKEELVNLLPRLFPGLPADKYHEMLDIDRKTLLVPITRFAEVGNINIHLSELPSNRPELDAALGLEWVDRIEDLQMDTFVCGETPAVSFPPGFAGFILAGMDGGATHLQSPLIDPEFGYPTPAPIRTEIWQVSKSSVPQDFIKMQILAA